MALSNYGIYCLRKKFLIKCFDIAESEISSRTFGSDYVWGPSKISVGFIWSNSFIDVFPTRVYNVILIFITVYVLEVNFLVYTRAFLYAYVPWHCAVCLRSRSIRKQRFSFGPVSLCRSMLESSPLTCCCSGSFSSCSIAPQVLLLYVTSYSSSSTNHNQKRSINSACTIDMKYICVSAPYIESFCSCCDWTMYEIRCGGFWRIILKQPAVVKAPEQENVAEAVD